MTFRQRSAVVIGLFSLLGAGVRAAYASPPSGYTLVWSDEFNAASDPHETVGSPPDPAYWWIRDGGNLPLTSIADSNGNAIDLNYSYYQKYFSDTNLAFPNWLFHADYWECNDRFTSCYPAVDNIINPLIGPLLTSITVAPPKDGQLSPTLPPLLTITRSFPQANTDGTIDWEDWEQIGNIQQVTDWNGRTVNYTESAIPSKFPSDATPPVDYGLMSTMEELVDVSQLQSTSSTGCELPDQYVYGYYRADNGDSGEADPFLSTVTTPSPAGNSQVSTLTFQYGDLIDSITNGEDGLGFGDNKDAVTSMVDAEGNIHAYTEGSSSDTNDATLTTVTTKDAGGHAVYTHTVGFDSQGEWTSDTDNAGNTIFQATYPSAPLDMYDPTIVQDGNGKQWTADWDIYGNLLDETSPKGVVTVYSYPNSDTTPYPPIPLTLNPADGSVGGPATADYVMGEVSEIQTSNGGDSLPAVNFDYWQPADLTSRPQVNPQYDLPGSLMDIYYPSPSGAASQAKISYTYDPLGDLTSVTTPGDDGTTLDGVVGTITTTVNMTMGTAPWTSNTFPVQTPMKGEPASVVDNTGRTVATPE